MTGKTIILIRIICAALLIYTLAQFISYRIENNVRYDCQDVQDCCKEWRHYEYEKKGCYHCSEGYPSRIEVLLNRAVPCGECRYEQSSTNTLIVYTNISRLKFERVDNDLKVNGKILKKNASLRRVNPLHSNPWCVLYTEVENKGLIKDCETPSQEEKIVITGSYGVAFSGVKGLIILLISVIPLVIIRKKPKAKLDINKLMVRESLILLAIALMINFSIADKPLHGLKEVSIVVVIIYLPIRFILWLLGI